MMPAVLTPCVRGSGADALAVADRETGAGHRHPPTRIGLSVKSSARPLGGVLTLQQLAAVETCVGLWARAMASAEVDPINELTRSVTAEVLHLTGRELAWGNALFLIDLVGSRVELRP